MYYIISEISRMLNQYYSKSSQIDAWTSDHVSQSTRRYKLHAFELVILSLLNNTGEGTALHSKNYRPGIIR